MPLFPRCEDTNPKEKEMFSKVLHQGTGKEGHHLTHTVKKNKDEPKCVYQVKTSLQCKRKGKITM